MHKSCALCSCIQKCQSETDIFCSACLLVLQSSQPVLLICCSPFTCLWFSTLRQPWKSPITPLGTIDNGSSGAGVDRLCTREGSDRSDIAMTRDFLGFSLNIGTRGAISPSSLAVACGPDCRTSFVTSSPFWIDSTYEEFTFSIWRGTFGSCTSSECLGDGHTLFLVGAWLETAGLHFD